MRSMTIFGNVVLFVCLFCFLPKEEETIKRTGRTHFSGYLKKESNIKNSKKGNSGFDCFCVFDEDDFIAKEGSAFLSSFLLMTSSFVISLLLTCSERRDRIRSKSEYLSSHVSIDQKKRKKVVFDFIF